MQKRKLTGQCRNSSLCMPSENIDVVLFNERGKVVAKTRTDKKGHWKIETSLASGKISFSGDGFVPKVIDISEASEIIRLLENDLIGYSDKLWYQPGEIVHFYVHSPGEFSAELVRYGKLRKAIKNLGTFPTTTQQAPDGFFVEAGPKWRESFQFVIPRDIEPGLYGILLQPRDKAFSPYHATILISTSPKNYGKKSKLLVLASTTTWQTYNVWGGRSRYRNFENYKRFFLKSWIHLF
ncbi:MAG: hypothetical protein GXO74_06490, partial [Calditrichaeota bacterium]|nr:hypothetical protein [Calditrichota bacterium]